MRTASLIAISGLFVQAAHADVVRILTFPNVMLGAWAETAERCTAKDKSNVVIAPANHDLESKVLDRASSIILPFPCRRTTAGEWINADLETSIDIRSTKWRPWQKAKARKLLLNTGSDLPHQNEQRWSDT